MMRAGRRKVKGLRFSEVGGRQRTLRHRLTWCVPLMLILLLVLLPGAIRAQSAPSTALYRISPGDTLEVNFRFTPEFNQTVVVQPDGHATLTVAGDLKMAGLTVEELREAIRKEATRKLVNPEFTVGLKDFDRPHIAVAGEVGLPARYDLRSSLTAMQAILQAGGPKETASMSNVVLFRRVSADYMEVHRLNFGKVEAGVAPREDPPLQPGDMIFVPRDKLTKLGRFVKTLNLGVYFNPTTIGLP